MKNPISLSLIALGAVAVSACGSAPTFDDLTLNEEPRMVLEVREKPLRLEIVASGGAECKEFKGRGCISSGRNQLVKATFQLAGEEGWHFSRFELCIGGEKSKRRCELNVFNRLEFGAVSKEHNRIALPNKRGIINLRDLDDRLREFVVANQNSVRANYYYRVEVCSDKDAEVCLWNEDPPWQNRGRY